VIGASYKKILILILWIVALIGLLSCLGFVAKSEKNIIASGLNILIHNNDENIFLRETDVREFLKEKRVKILSNKYSNISIPELEKALNTHPAIENAEVSGDINGKIKVEILQRTPVLRVINKDGESYYIDSQTKLMPLNENYSARVIVANGEISEPYARRYQFSVDQIGRNKSFSGISVLDDILNVSKYINRDSMLTQLIHQIYVNSEQELELYPSVGNHRIIFGDANNIPEKFSKLKLFYTQGLNKMDAWTRYSTINLKYKNLVVCTKKEMYGK
jgi:cell division protein FtsQ